MYEDDGDDKNVWYMVLYMLLDFMVLCVYCDVAYRKLSVNLSIDW